MFDFLKAAAFAAAIILAGVFFAGVNVFEQYGAEADMQARLAALLMVVALVMHVIGGGGFKSDR
jgi:hypothetical protein